MSGARRHWSLVATLLALAGPALAPNADAAPDRAVHAPGWFVHADLIDVGAGEDLAYWQAFIAERLTEADLLVQGHQGPADVGCCVSIDPGSVAVFGSPGDGLDTVTSNAEWNAILATGPGSYLVELIHVCGATTGTGVRGCAQTPGDVLVVSLEAEPTHFLPTVMAHETGHNAGLNHVSGNPCELMAASGAGGCLSTSECGAFIADADSTSGSCGCLADTLGDPPVPAGWGCVHTSGNGICSGGVCGDSTTVAGARLVVAGGPGAASGQTPNAALAQSGATNDWSNLGLIPSEIAGLAYDPGGDVLYGIEVLAGDDALVTLDPTTGLKTGTIGTLSGKSDVVALAFDPDVGGDRLLAIQLDDDFFGQTCLGALAISPPCFSELFEIDPIDASVTTLGEVNNLIVTDGATGLAWDDTNAVLYTSTPAGLFTLNLASCDGSTCSYGVQIDNVYRNPSGLAWDAGSGRLIRSGDNGFGRSSVDTIDVSSAATESVRGVDAYTVGGIAAMPVPEPGLLAGLASGALLLLRLSRGRRQG